MSDRNGPLGVRRVLSRHLIAATMIEIGYPTVWIVGPLILWEIGGRALHVPDYLLPLPSAIVQRLIAERGALLLQAGRSSILIIEGFLIGAILGGIVGFAIASVRLLEMALYPLIVFIQTIPQIAIAPLLLVWFGYGALPKVLLASMLTFFPVLVDSSTGFKTIDRRLFYVSRSMGASRWQTLTRIQFPAAMPLIFSGCKISMMSSVSIVIVVEFLSSNEGLGYVAVRALSNHDLPLMFASIFVAVGIGLALSYVIDVIEMFLMPWVGVQERNQ